MRNNAIKPGDGADVAGQLQGLALALDGIAGELHAISGERRGAERSGRADRAAAGAPDVLAELAQAAYRDRRRRGQIFADDSLFGEPAWDILLDLFIAAVRKKRVAVTSACIGAAVPTTTALRWLKILEDKRLIEREEDAEDARRTFLRLSPRGFEAMADYFGAERPRA